MPRLYIANITQQIHRFLYTVPETDGGLRTQDIQPGGQIEISDSENMNQTQLDAIIQQHARYGMINVKEIDRAKRFAGLCYSVGEKIPLKKLEIGLDHNFDVLTERGHETRKMNAVAISNTVEDHIQRQAGSVHTEVIEDERKGEHKDFDKETMVVTRDPEREAVKKTQARAGRSR